MRILYIDPVATESQAVTSWLWNHDVDVSSCKASALEKIENDYDLVLVDQTAGGWVPVTSVPTLTVSGLQNLACDPSTRDVDPLICILERQPQRTAEQAQVLRILKSLDAMDRQISAIR